MKRVLVLSSISLMLIFIVASPVALAQTPAESVFITVDGQLVNATPGGSAEAGIPMMLHLYDGDQMTDMVHGESGPEGVFRFENVEVIEGRFFEVMATVGQTTYFSESMPATPGQETLELPVTIYDSTTDSSTIRVDQMHLLVEFLSPAQVQVMEIYIVSNNGDKSVENAVTLDEGQTASLRFNLPSAAKGLSFQGNNANGRFIHTVDGFADTLGVPPGSGTVQFTVKYLLSYKDGLEVERSLSYPTEGFSMILPQVGVSLTSDSLTPVGSREIQDGRMVDVFTGDGFQAGQSISFRLNGQPKVETEFATSSGGEASTFSAQITTGESVLVAGLVVVGLALIGGGIQWWRRTAAGPASIAGSAIEPDSPEAALIRAIAELDEVYQVGTIPAEVYITRRNLLRAELKALLAGPRQTPGPQVDVQEREAKAQLG